MRKVLVLVILLLAVIGGAVFVSRSVEEQPTRTIEVEVTPNAAPR